VTVWFQRKPSSSSSSIKHSLSIFDESDLRYRPAALRWGNDGPLPSGGHVSRSIIYQI
jgi:hypothetical protein